MVEKKYDKIFEVGCVIFVIGLLVLLAAFFFEPIKNVALLICFVGLVLMVGWAIVYLFEI